MLTYHCHKGSVSIMELTYVVKLIPLCSQVQFVSINRINLNSQQPILYVFLLQHNSYTSMVTSSFKGMYINQYKTMGLQPQVMNITLTSLTCHYLVMSYLPISSQLQSTNKILFLTAHLFTKPSMYISNCRHTSPLQLNLTSFISMYYCYFHCYVYGAFVLILMNTILLSVCQSC